MVYELCTTTFDGLVQWTFQTVDLDHSGVMSKDEFKEMCKLVRLPMHVPAISLLIFFSLSL